MKEREEGSPRPERRDAAENRQRILDAATRLFELHGAAQVSMNQIATEAQIGPGTLYRRYRNKSELCLDLMKDNIVMLFDDIEDYLAQRSADAPGLRLRGLLGLFIRFREKKTLLLSGLEESPAAPRTGSRTQSPLYQQLHELLVGLFEEMAAADGGGANRASSVFRADMLLVALSSESYAIQRNVRGYSPEQVLGQLCLTFGIDGGTV